MNLVGHRLYAFRVIFTVRIPACCRKLSQFTPLTAVYFQLD